VKFNLNVKIIKEKNERNKIGLLNAIGEAWKKDKNMKKGTYNQCTKIKQKHRKQNMT